MKIRNLVIASVLLTLLATGLGMAQQEERRTDLGRSFPCPHPTKLVINGHNPATVIASEISAANAAAVAGSAFNQTQVNKNFGYTFTFPVCPKECCLWTTGYLQVTFKALQGGPAGSASSANDQVSIWVNGAAVVPSQLIWGTGAVATGATKTTTFAIPGSSLAHGHVTLLAGDDTAIGSAVLTLEGCCVCVK